MALCPGLPGWAGTRKVNLFGTILEQEMVSCSAIYKFAPCRRQITMPAPHHAVFLQDAFPATQPTASKHWRQNDAPYTTTAAATTTTTTTYTTFL